MATQLSRVIVGKSLVQSLSLGSCACSCPRDVPVYSRGSGGQTPKAGRDGVDFYLFQGRGAICSALEHIV